MENANVTPLVSVVVITYNSSETVLETLQSVKEQTYHKLELIISDDASIDNTISICRKWVEDNKSFFVNCHLITSSKNTGVPANLNRGISAASGEWIKSIAGDDLLVDKAIERYVESINASKGRIYISKVKLFGGAETSYMRSYKMLESMYDVISSHDRKLQYRTSLYRHILPGPALFYEKKLWEDIGRFDETYRLSEEMTFQLKVFELTTVFFIDEYLVRWRQREESLSHQSCSPSHRQDIDFYFNEKRKRLKEEKMYLHLLDSDITNIVMLKEFEGKSKIWGLLKLLSPLSYYRMVNKLISVARFA